MGKDSNLNLLVEIRQIKIDNNINYLTKIYFKSYKKKRCQFRLQSG